MSRATVWSVKVCYKHGWKRTAIAKGRMYECGIVLGPKFFGVSKREQRWVMAHETGHTFEEQIENVERELAGGRGSDVLGRMKVRGKYTFGGVEHPEHLHFEGVYGEYNPSEAFATCVAEMYLGPAEFKEKYPKAYAYVKSVLPANWKEAIRANIAQIPSAKKEHDLIVYAAKLAASQTKHSEKQTPKRKPLAKPVLTIEQQTYLKAHKGIKVGYHRWAEFHQVAVEDAIREAKHLEMQGEHVQIEEIISKDSHPTYTVYMVVRSSPPAASPRKQPARKQTAPTPSIPPILTAPPELAADVLGGGMGLTPTAAPKRKPAARTTRKPKAKKTAVKPKKTAKKTAAKPKAKKPTAGTKLTPAQREYMALNGFVRVKRGGKYVRITR